jgi:hypothetical protein
MDEDSEGVELMKEQILSQVEGMLRESESR